MDAQDGSKDSGQAIYGAVQLRAASHPDLNASDLRALIKVASRDRMSLTPEGRREGRSGCFQSINEMAREIGMHPRQFRRSAEKLVRFGFIQKTPGPKAWLGNTLRLIYEGGDHTVTIPLTEQSLPPVPHVTTPVTVETVEGCPDSHPIRKPVRKPITEPEESLSSYQDEEQHSGQNDLVTKIVSHWSAVATPAGAVPVRKVGEKRKKLILQSIAAEGVEDILAAISRIARTKWATGRGVKEYRVDIEWLLEPGKVNSILEGKFDDRLAGDGLTRALHRSLEAHAAKEWTTEWSEGGSDLEVAETDANSQFLIDMIEAEYSDITDDGSPWP